MRELKYVNCVWYCLIDVEQWGLSQHRAQSNCKFGERRISIAMFFNPKFEAKIGPMTSMLNPQNPLLFKSIRMEEFVKDLFTLNVNKKSHLEKLRIKSVEGNTTT